MMRRVSAGSLLAAAVLVAAAVALGDASPTPPPHASATLASADAAPQVIRVATSLDTLTLAHELADAYAGTGYPLTPEVTIVELAKIADAVLASQNDLGIVLTPVPPGQEFIPPPGWENTEALLIGWEAVVVIAHPNRQAQGWDRGTLAEVLEGEIQDWQALGAGQGPISLLGRAEGAASREALMGYLGLTALSSAVELWPNDAEICLQVASRPLALGWIGASAITDRCQPLALDGVEPTAQAVQSGEYGARLALVLIVAPNAPPEAQALANWVASAQGQRIVAQRYIPAF